MKYPSGPLAVFRKVMPGQLAAAFNIALLVAWVFLYLPVFRYLGVLFSREEFRTNQILLGGIAGLLAYRAYRARLRPCFDRPPRLDGAALSLALGASLLYLLVERFLDINILSAFLFALASYGLLGLWLDARRWRQGFPAMLLVAAVLPFGEHLETFVGYPLRTLTAGIVRDGLVGMGFHSVGVDTILVFESGISQVDIPCSGVKSLWTGAMFLLAATWIENRRPGWRWLGAALVMGALLFCANLLRVAVLALTGPALGWTLLARMLHIPLGVLGFAGACAAALALLRRLPEWNREPLPGSAACEESRSPRPAWLAPVVVLIVAVMALVYTPRAAGQAVAAAPVWSFPQGMAVQLAPLLPQEMQWVQQAGADTADRYTFTWQEPGAPAGSRLITGTVMLLTSQTWRGQHNPERCFEVFGLTVRDSFTYLPAEDFSLRYLTLSGPTGAGQVSAAYWLQSASEAYADFGRRIWADLDPQRERWVLVTILLDQVYDPQLPEMNQLFSGLQAAVHSSLIGGN
jgi:exosortase O